nr:hypothetical protein [Tanacetum cinerariifolium]
IWHAFFGVAWLNNDINVLYQTPLFNDFKTGRAPKILFMANGVSYPSGYYLVDGIYSELAPLVKTIPELADDDHNNMDCAGRQGISGLLKCTYAIRQLAYSVHADFLDEYMQISERTSHTALDHFCQAVMEIYGPEFFRKPTVTDIEKLYLHHEEKHEFSGMLGSLDYTD